MTHEMWKLTTSKLTIIALDNERPKLVKQRIDLYCFCTEEARDKKHDRNTDKNDTKTAALVNAAATEDLDLGPLEIWKSLSTTQNLRVVRLCRRMSLGQTPGDVSWSWRRQKESLGSVSIMKRQPQHTTTSQSM